MDHHCPWINNCVGAYNHKYFFLYMMYTGLLSTITMVYNAIAIFYYVLRRDELLQFHSLSFRTLGLVYSIVALLAAVAFGLTILEPFLNSLYSAIDNQTTVESEQDLYGPELDIKTAATYVMGDDFTIFWLMPTTPSLYVNYMEMLYSYENPARKKPSTRCKTKPRRVDKNMVYYPKKRQSRSKFEVPLLILIFAAAIYVFKCPPGGI